MSFRVSAAALTAVFLCLAAAPAGAAGPLTEAIVKAVLAKPVPGDTYVWRKVQIAAPRKASAGEIAAAGLPANATIWPVKADYTEIGTGNWGRDYTWNYYFYQDDFGDWARQSNATPGNSESEPYMVKR
jgi:hypothetical protein